MKRLALLVQILLLTAAIALVVMGSSVRETVVEPMRDIEELWAIEDTRSPSDGPLVTELYNLGVPAAYSAEENTFYCTLGLENGEEWPEIHLTTPEVSGGVLSAFRMTIRMTGAPMRLRRVIRMR